MPKMIRQKRQPAVGNTNNRPHAAIAGWPWLACVLVAATLLAMAPALRAADKDKATDAASNKPERKDPRAGKAPKLPHVTVDREKRVIDVEAEVCLREGDWLELLACTRGTKEHEAVLATRAKASHVHLALLMIGVKPGAPLKVTRTEDDIKVTPPHGDEVIVTLHYEKDGKKVSVDANQWVLNQKTEKPLTGNTWLFAGSMFERVRIPIRPLAENIEDQKYEEKEVYAADMNGTVLSLVNFGDDVLSRNTTMGNRDDDGTWGVNTKLIPPLKTKVIIRLQPKPKAKDDPKRK